ncbi:hypothetical protein llap_16835 [Limosa lapponica baueri]|uniref:Non-structural maintenance of chromosomes element 4 n=1 Tax=Limosa lapponica baueri TaxID=1758121 RepID=A0A2I0TGD6_LIMLA|nr:hypothetical protein llap_16835 [Limosa lapponica baueri]
MLRNQYRELICSVQRKPGLTFMGINRIEENDSDSESTSGGYLPSNAWHKLGEETEKYFRRAPSFHYIQLWKLKKMEESHQEATEKEVERILGLLQTHFKNDPDTPISFFDLVIDPNSFARTVENIFHVSFIIREIVETYEITEPMISPPYRNEDEMDIA